LTTSPKSYYKDNSKTVIKTGDMIRLAEAAAMELVRSRTTIPVPEVYNAYIDPATGHPAIVIEFIEGQRLEKVWDTFSIEETQEVLEQFRDIFSQLRNIKGSFIGSVDGTACEDQVFCEELGAYGPYDDEDAFNQGIVKGIRKALSGGWVETVVDMVTTTLKGHEIVLTHCDFAPRNVIVQGTKIVAILD
jgi:aminoglycoside phosphotransferase (APT) family kinase protein